MLETSLCNVQAAETSWGCRLAWPTVLSRLSSAGQRKPHSERLRVSSSASLLPCPQADGCFTNYFIITSYRHIHYFSDDGASEENVTVLWKRFDINFDKKGSSHSPLKISFINGHSFKILRNKTMEINSSYNFSIILCWFRIILSNLQSEFCFQSKELLENCPGLILSFKLMDKTLGHK